MLNELLDLPRDSIDDGSPLHTDAVDEQWWTAVPRTGVKGIGFTMKQDSRATYKKQPYVSVHWIENGKRRSTSDSLAKHGLSSALTWAAETLIKNVEHELTVEEMLDTTQPAIPELLEQANVHKRNWQM